ncbi:M18 family aminopeptidase [uncultured Agrococcus sp.]|uniref:M18 family aminopeptidase n=1 Tax=uncultured Agrococcus sp. TaxID=382258 RepID=UPI0025CC7265|nr:M18 family aminopeptidase [uncultured Agrococcus sp.]
MPTRIDAVQHAQDFIDFVAAAPSSYHAAAEGARRLALAGWQQQDEREAWDASPGGHFIVRGGALIAWWVPEELADDSAFRIVGSHTDSPSFKLKPTVQTNAVGYEQAAVEVYGGPLIGSWTDRELGFAGRVVDRSGREHLVSTGPIARIPQLAIHLNRSANEEGLKLGKQAHTAPVISTTSSGGPGLLGALAESAGIAAKDIAGHDVYAFDVQRGAMFGANDEFIASSRMDNLTSVHASLAALLRATSEGYAGRDVLVLAAFDHEEVGSETVSGASGPVLADVLTRTGRALGNDEDARLRMLRRSWCVSSDAGHAVHPNYVGHHDPAHHPVLGQGPLLKVNANQRYASDAAGAALWNSACEAAGSRAQAFVSNNDVPCGSTIGPLTATRLGIRTVDVGVPLLSMHSAREMASVSDLAAIAGAIEAVYAGR